MYQELLTWTGAHPSVSADALPEPLARALHASFQHVYSEHSQHAALSGNPPASKAKGSADKISLATFVIALCIVAMQVSSVEGSAFLSEIDF